MTIKKEQFRRIGLEIVFSLIFVLFVTPPVLADVSLPAQGEGPTRVSVGLFVIDVDEIRTADQSFDANVYIRLRWRDPRLAHKGRNKISRPLEEIWHPRIQFVNQQKVWATFPNIVEIAPDGEVIYRQRVWGSFSQPLLLRDFPFDRHTISIQLAAAGYKPDEIEFVVDPDTFSGISRKLSIPDWDILNIKEGPRPFEPIPGMEALAGFVLSFEAKRRSGYFIVKVILPLILIVAMSWVVFWIDPKESGTQISVSVTTMLTLIAYRFAVGTFLPKISYLTRLDYFILASTFLVFAALVMVVITSTLARKDKLALARSVDRKSRWLFPVVFVLLTLEALVFRFAM